MATSIRSRLAKLERRAAPYRRPGSETEIVETLLARTQFWTDEDFLAFCEEVKAGGISEETRARMDLERAEERRRYYERR